MFHVLVDSGRLRSMHGGWLLWRERICGMFSGLLNGLWECQNNIGLYRDDGSLFTKAITKATNYTCKETNINEIFRYFRFKLSE